MKNKTIGFALAILLATISFQLPAQYLDAPPNGGSQRAIVIQYIGIASVSIDYGSPRVTDKDGISRRGNIWGGLVPYNGGIPTPWRGGANENTKITLSHDAKINGIPLKAGAYGLHFIPATDEWVVIFSMVSNAFGSFTYSEKEDALRIRVRPETSAYHEWLTYEFDERTPFHTLISMKWEDLKISFSIEFDTHENTFDSFRKQLRGIEQFSWEPWNEAARYCLENDVNLAEGLSWSDRSLGINANFTNTMTKSGLLKKSGMTAQADSLFGVALSIGNVQEIYAYGRDLLSDKETESARKVFLANEARFPDAWHAQLGLTRYFIAVNDAEKALASIEKGMKQAKTDRQKKVLNDLKSKLQK